MNLKREMARRGVELAPVAKAIRYEYPGFDIYLLSKVCNENRYGVRLLARTRCACCRTGGRAPARGRSARWPGGWARSYSGMKRST